MAAQQAAGAVKRGGMRLDKLDTVHRFILALLVLAFVVLGVLVMIAGQYDTLYDTGMYDQDSVHTISSGWRLNGPNGREETVELPIQITYENTGEYTFTKTLPGGILMPTVPVLYFISNHMDVRLYLDGELLYSYENTPQMLSKSTGNAYHLVPLANNLDGKELTIALKMRFGERITYEVPAPQIGTKAAVVRHLFQAEQMKLVFVFMTFSFGILL